MKELKISISGVRGIVGETLTPELIVSFSQAFGTYLEGGRVLISQDTRASSEMVNSAVLGGLLSCGCEVIDLGVCPTPALQLMIKETTAAGGIAITAGHNEESWNALKFIQSSGLFLNSYQGEELLDIFHQGEFKKANFKEFKKVRKEKEAIKRHLQAIIRVLDKDLIKKKKFKVAIDCCNGACSYSTPLFLKKLGCEVVAINDEPGAGFPHEPAPKPANMAQLRALVKASSANVGFAQDADGDRLGIVTEEGVALSEEYSFCLAAKFISQREKGIIVTNLSTTQAIDEIAKLNDCRVLRTKIGQAYIAEEALACQAIIGGEGSGGVLFPRINYAHDSTAALGHILQYMAKTDSPLSSLVKLIPQYEIVKKEVDCPPEEIYSVIQRVREWIEKDKKEARLDLEDGIKLTWDDSFLHVRSSITEPLIRVVAEAKTKEKAEELSNWLLRKIEQSL